MVVRCALFDVCGLIGFVFVVWIMFVVVHLLFVVGCSLSFVVGCYLFFHYLLFVFCCCSFLVCRFVRLFFVCGFVCGCRVRGLSLFVVVL